MSELIAKKFKNPIKLIHDAYTPHKRGELIQRDNIKFLKSDDLSLFLYLHYST